MAIEQMFIPEKIKVGFNKREDTYTGKLAYVIYTDSKGKLRKEASWTQWSDNLIPAEDYDNVPTEGFVINKTAGGGGGHYDSRQTTIRVYDPRGFEVEISVPNLILILETSSCYVGKGLKGEFVYSWEGTELVLLPVKSETYKKCITYTKLQYESVTKKSLIPGALYTTNKQKCLMYLGYYQIYDPYGEISKTPKFVFHDASVTSSIMTKYVIMTGIGSISGVLDSTVSSSYVSCLDDFLHSAYASPIVSLEPVVIEVDLSPLEQKDHPWYQSQSSDFVHCISTASGLTQIDYRSYYSPKTKKYLMQFDSIGIIISLKDGKIKFDYTMAVRTGVVAPPVYKLVAHTKNGSRLQVLHQHSANGFRRLKDGE